MDKRIKHEDRNVDVFLKNYKLDKILGIGSTGKVKLAKHKLTGREVAIKILNRKKIAKMGLEQKVRREIKIMKLFMHPHIVQLYEVIETPTDTYVVMEYLKSGDAFDYITQKGRLKEDEARRLFQQIISGVEHCHRNMIVHRDLKPENVLLDSNFNAKIADFGFSNVMYDGHFLKTSCGSPDYAAPEIICGKLYAGPEVDIWSCGVILYALLCGFLPFGNGNLPILQQKIKNGVYRIPSFLSAAAGNLISRILVVDPLRRITIPQIRQHPWFQAHLPRYLAVKPISIIQQSQKIDEDVLQKVVMMGFNKNQVVESLHNKRQNQATVTYHLLLGDRFTISDGYLGAPFQESMEANHMRPTVATLPAVERMDNQVVGIMPQILLGAFLIVFAFFSNDLQKDSSETFPFLVISKCSWRKPLMTTSWIDERRSIQALSLWSLDEFLQSNLKSPSDGRNGSRIRAPSLNAIWNPPAEGFWKINTDAAWTVHSGVGVICGGNVGEVVGWRLQGIMMLILKHRQSN